ncbi:hypothetical protein [Guyparkeria sp.]|uniref:hypothetical protein n=1 Tax=Guyparkeria sp. TaxID=2035736 RepID=UPI00397095EB
MVFKSPSPSTDMSAMSVRRYHVTGMDTRCELLFHSMMRLVGDKAVSRWVHDAREHDLVIIGPDATDLACPTAVRRPFSHFTSGRTDDCAMLRLAGMVEALNAVEQALAAAGEGARSPGTGPTRPTGEEVMKLTRWPEASLMAFHPASPKMATLLLSRPMTLMELVRLSGIDRRVCAQFVTRLSQRGLLDRRWSADRKGPAPLCSGGGGLFAMIRARLGLGEEFG